jgi:hypothetical protein
MRPEVSPEAPAHLLRLWYGTRYDPERPTREGCKMKRRDFITLIGGAAAWPLAARAQRGERMRRIGVLMALSEGDPQGQALASFRCG